MPRVRVPEVWDPCDAEHVEHALICLSSVCCPSIRPYVALFHYMQRCSHHCTVGRDQGVKSVKEADSPLPRKFFYIIPLKLCALVYPE